MREHRFILLLCTLILLIGSAPLVRAVGSGRHPILAGSVITILFALMLLSAVFAVSRSRTTKIIALLLAIPTIALQGINLWHASDLFSIPAYSMGIGCRSDSSPPVAAQRSALLLWGGYGCILLLATPTSESRASGAKSRITPQGPHHARGREALVSHHHQHPWQLAARRRPRLS